MIGLATKAGKTVTGEFMSEKAVKEGKACLVIVASDASDNTKKKFNNMEREYYKKFWKIPAKIYQQKKSKIF